MSAERDATTVEPFFIAAAADRTLPYCERVDLPGVYIRSRCSIRKRGLELVLLEAGLATYDIGRTTRPGRSLVAVLDLAVGDELESLPYLEQELQSIRQRAEMPVVALLSPQYPDSYTQVLARGVQSIVEEDTSVAGLVMTILGAHRGWSTMPIATAKQLASIRGPAPPVELDALELQLLRSLAAGTTTLQMAEELGYSEREIHRRLSALRRQLSTDGRIQTVIKATRLGLV